MLAANFSNNLSLIPEREASLALSAVSSSSLSFSQSALVLIPFLKSSYDFVHSSTSSHNALLPFLHKTFFLATSRPLITQAKVAQTPPLKIVNSPVENVAFKDIPKTRLSSFAFLKR